MDMPSRPKQTKQAGNGRSYLHPLPPYSMPSSRISLHQDKATKMPMMPPGCQTGVYYMPIGNLHWNVTWQDLKDFCRDPKDGQGPCDVEHAEVYRGGKNSKSRGYGYVKIRGEKDFWRVYNYLNGREWKGLCLQPDCRNSDQQVALSYIQLGTFPSGDQNHRRGSSASSSSSRRPSIGGESVSSQESNWSSPTVMTPQSMGTPNWYQGGYYADPNTVIQTQQYAYQQGPNQVYPQYNAPSSQPEYPTYTMTPTNVAFMPIPENAPYSYVPITQAQALTGYQVNYGPPMSNPTGMPEDQQLANSLAHMSLQPHHTGTPFIETEARKILIRNLPHQMTAEEVRNLISHYSTNPPGLDRNAVEELELPAPAHHDSKKRRGPAFAVLRDSGMARRCIESLHGKDYGGRELDIRLAKEGVASVPRRMVTDDGSRRGSSSGSSAKQLEALRHGERKSGGDRGTRSGKSGYHHGSSSSGSRDGKKSCASAASTSDPVPSRSKGSQTPIVVNGSSPPQ